MNFKIATALVLMGFAWVAQAAGPTTPDRFVANGVEVTDSMTGLVWARCSVGQTWDGSTCTGTAKFYSQMQALTLAQTASGWRLPNVKELASIADKGCQLPAIDSAAFPNTPSHDYWSSSPYVANANEALGVAFNYGHVNSKPRTYDLSVRLVRASQ